MKLGLGTAQFGLDYGITNRRGRVPQDEVERILERAVASGVEVVDTAGAYGDSEAILGQALGSRGAFRIVTKTPPLQAKAIGAPEISQVLEAFEQSLARLRRATVYGLLLHRAADAFVPGGERLLEALAKLKAKGLIDKVGASVYTGEEIDRLLAIGGIDLVQLPLSWLDQRLAASGHLEKLHAAGVEVHARSAFLQGMLLAPPESLPEQFAPLRAHLRTCRARFERAGMAPVEAALGYPLGRKEVSTMLCGVTSLAEFDELLAGYPGSVRQFDWSPCALTDPAWLDPSRWPARAPEPALRAGR